MREEVYAQDIHIEWMWRKYLPRETDRDDPLAAPWQARSLTGVAPALVITAEHDVLRDEAERYAERLREAGVATTVRRFDGVLHGFFGMLGRIDEATEAIVLRRARCAPRLRLRTRDRGRARRAGFEAVRAAFEENFAERGELGAFAAYVDGVAVVDLWGGVADASTGRPWRPDALTVVFSGTRAMAAVCVLLLIERGQLALDQPVAEVWPEFAAASKATITVAEVMSHRTRLPVIDEPIRRRDIADDRTMAARLAAQAPETDPRAAAMYHPLTYGWLCGELVRRASASTSAASSTSRSPRRSSCSSGSGCRPRRPRG